MGIVEALERQIELLKAENNRLRAGHDRYEKIRKMNLIDIGLIFSANIHGDGTFDDLVDRFGTETFKGGKSE